MTVQFYTSDPAALLAKFKEKIKLGNKEGGISTWKFKDGDFYHVADQLIDGAKVNPNIITTGKSPSLEFRIHQIGDKSISVYCYKELHGNLVATFIEHFSQDFTSASVESAMRKKS